MRLVHDLEMELGGVRIEDIQLDLKSRDDIPALLLGLQHLYRETDLRERLFGLLEEHLLPDVDMHVGRPGMDMWKILVMGVIKQGLGCDFDRLQELVNHHATIREFLGHADIWDKRKYQHQTLMDNVSHLSPALLVAVNQLIVESGHAVARKKPGGPLRGRCDSFVVETDVHDPTDVNLLWDAMRCLIRDTGRATIEVGLTEWRQWRHLSKKVKSLFNKVRTTRRATREDVEEYLTVCQGLVERAEESLTFLRKMPWVDDAIIWQIDRWLEHAWRQLDQVERRLLKGETIPQEEKVFSIFEEHTRWISKGKAGRPVELGVPVCVMEDHHGFILHHAVMWDGSDVDHAVAMVTESQKRFADLRAVSFDRGFHSPSNRARLDDLLDCNALPKKGRLTEVERRRQEDGAFVAMRRQHPAVESAINNLEHRGLDRIVSYGSEGFERTTALAVVAFNIHRIGLTLRRLSRRRYAA